MSRLSRRRFLTITACAALAGSARGADPVPSLTWRGVALGADVSITLEGPEAVTRPALARARLEIEAYEQRFSLFRDGSDLVRLNRTGVLRDLDPRWQQMVALSDRLHRATEGVFDPSMQPLWLAHATGGDIAAARDLVGWERLAREGRGLRLAPGQALSFNGIAQGVATDAVRASLKAAGLRRVLVDIGETHSLGGPWRIGAVDPAHGLFAEVALRDMAFAVSSPASLRLSPEAQHILHPAGFGRVEWSSVAVLGASAGLADGLSTAACLMPQAALAACAARLDGVARVIALDHAGARHDISMTG